MLMGTLAASTFNGHGLQDIWQAQTQANKKIIF
jgi:hypothetical protein